MALLFENGFNEIFTGSGIRDILGLPARNNQYISQPNFTVHPFNLNQSVQWQSINGKELEVYQTTPELRIVLDRLALMFANGVWKEYDKNGNEIEDSETLRLLENPNIFQSRNEFLFQFYLQRNLYANAFTYQLKGSNLQDIPSALWNLSPSRMGLNRTGKIWNQSELEQIISHYTFRMDGSADERFETKDIIQFSIPNPDDPLLGTSPLISLRMPISNIRAAYGYRNVILTKKGAIGMWSTDGKDAIGSISLTDEENKKMSKQLTRTYGIGDNQASVMIANKPMKWTPATYPTKDLMLFEEIDSNKKAIIDTFGANENMFSSGVNAKGATFTNVEMGERQCYQSTIIPAAADYANGLAKRFGILDQGGWLELSYDDVAVMKSDNKTEAEAIEKRANAAATLLQNGYSAAEVNEILGWELTGGKAPSANPVG